MKKAQTEIIGLAIVIILISLGMMFYFRLSRQTDSDVKQDFLDTKLASNTISVLLRTTDACLDVELKHMFQACGEGMTAPDYCGSHDPCGYVEGTTRQILDNSLAKWKKKYIFTATINDVEKIRPPS